MPFIKKSYREDLDEEIITLTEAIKLTGKTGPALSYVFLKLLVDVYGGDVDGMIEAIGVIEETKLTYYSMHMLPLEQRIILRRFLDPEGSY